MESPLLPAALVVLYAIFYAAWVLFFNRRLNAWIRGKIGAFFGFTVVERMRLRTTAWEIKGPHTWEQGCLVRILEFVTTFGCLGLPIFLGMAAVVLALFALSGE